MFKKNKITKKNYYDDIKENYFTPSSSFFILNRIQKINDTLKNLTLNESDKSQQIKRDFDELYSSCSQMYSSSLSYAPITNYVYRETKDNEDMTLLIETVSFKAEEKLSELELSGAEIDDFRAMKVIYKVIQHMILADTQINNLDKDLRLEIINQNEKIKDMTKDLNKTLYKLNETKSSMYTEFIAILGIFSALLFGLFVGFDVFKEIISNMASNAKISRSIIMGSLLLLGLNFLVFLLFEGISSLTNKKFKKCCKENDCKHNIFQKYPVFIISTICLSLVIIVATLLMLLNYNGAIYKLDFWVNYAGWPGFILGIIIGLIFVFIIIMWLNRKYIGLYFFVRNHSNAAMKSSKKAEESAKKAEDLLMRMKNQFKEKHNQE